MTSSVVVQSNPISQTQVHSLLTSKYYFELSIVGFIFESCGNDFGLKILFMKMAVNIGWLPFLNGDAFLKMGKQTKH